MVLPLYVKAKHCPHVSAFHPGMVEEPPMFGKVGICPKFFHPYLIPWLMWKSCQEPWSVLTWSRGHWRHPSRLLCSDCQRRSRRLRRKTRSLTLDLISSCLSQTECHPRVYSPVFAVAIAAAPRTRRLLKNFMFAELFRLRCAVYVVKKGPDIQLCS